jgi:sugar phosphate isomerase/epimerase
VGIKKGVGRMDGMKIGISSYSFGRLVDAGLMTQLEVIPKAKEMGFDEIEFSTFQLPKGETPLSFAPYVREECERVGLKITSYTIGADFLNCPGGDWRAEVERLKDEVKVAQILGSPTMRHDVSIGFPGWYKEKKGFVDVLDVFIKGCREVTKYASDLGIKTMVENHGYFFQDSDRVEMLVTGVNHENFGVLIDIGNFLCVDENPAEAVGRLAPYVFHVHAKDFHVKNGTAPMPGEGWFLSRAGNYLRGSILGHGDVPVVQCLRILTRHGYNGIVSLEFEGIEEPLTGIRISRDNLRAYLEQV